MQEVSIDYNNYDFQIESLRRRMIITIDPIFIDR
jgi:hypothetical protein